MNIQNNVTLGHQTYTVSAQSGESETANVTQAVNQAIANLKEISNSGLKLEDLIGNLPSQIKDAFNVEIKISVEDAIQCESNLQSLVEQMPADINAVMALFQRLAQEMRNANRQIRAAELDNQVGDLLSAANEMQTAAKFRFAAGCVQGAMQIASGGIQMVGSFKAGSDAHAAGKQASASQETAAAAPAAASASPAAAAKGAPPTPFEVTMAKTKAASDLIGGASEVIGSSLKYQADLADVQAKRLEANARLHESASSEANEMMQQMLEVIRDVREKIGSIQQASIETNRGIARNV